MATVNEPCRPSEADMIEVPRRPDLRCWDHEACIEVIHSLVGRVAQLESRVATIEERNGQ